MLLQELVEEDFGISGRGKWFHADQHDSLVVNAEDQTWYWNSKGIRGGILEYLTLIRGLEKRKAEDFLKNSIGGLRKFQEKSFQPSSPYSKLIDIFWESGKSNREYWYKRCLRDDTIDRYRLGYYAGWSLIPLFYNGEFSNFQMRRDEPKKEIIQWYRTKHIYLFNEDILNFTDRIYITEGLVDCILLNQEGFPSVAATGVNLWQPDWFSKFNKIKEIYYLEDNDKAGRIGARLVANSLGVGRVKVISFPYGENKYDTGKYFQDGGTANSLREYINKNSKYLFELEVPNGRGKHHLFNVWKYGNSHLRG